MRILYIDIDSMRPDHLGCYGYHRNTSPNIDSIAAEGVRFGNCYTPDAPCLPSRTALYSGRFGYQTGVVGHGGTAAQPRIEGPSRNFQDLFGNTGLARQLQLAGLHTAMISPFGQRHSAHWFYAGFNEIHNTGKGGMESAEEIWPVIDKWLQDNSGRDNWFLHVNLWDPHTPYRVPLEYGHPFSDSPLPKWLDDPEVLRRHRRMTGPHTAQDISMYNGTPPDNFPRQPGSLDDMDDLRKLVDGYDTGVRYADDHVGRILTHLREKGIFEETAVIISADHGENLGELGIYAEHGTADVATCRIPMIIKWPGGSVGCNENFHYNIDLAPTLMELMGRISPDIWDGSSFAGAITGSDPDCGRESVILSQCAHVCQRSVRWDKWLYLQTRHDGFHLFPEEMLYDLEKDPFEQSNLASDFPLIAGEGRTRLEKWRQAQHDQLQSIHPGSSDPMESVLAEGGPFHARMQKPGNPGGIQGLETYIRRLEETGRTEGAEALRSRYINKP